MGFLELLLLAVSLSMDAFAVAICKGLSLERINGRQMCAVGAWFGGFQALMPAIGFFLGSTFAKYITPIDHWIAFVLLGLIGGNMIKEALSKQEDCCDAADASLSWRAMLPLAIATSIDALAVGITFAFLLKGWGELLLAVGLIGVTTFALSGAGVRMGHTVGARYKSKAELAGGVILILLGLKILLEHLGILAVG